MPLADYPFDKKGQLQMISFVEYCYSCYSNNMDDYALYVYVYNPQGITFDFDSASNQIQMRVGESELNEKYRLRFLNYSTATGCEGLFYKFKVILTDTQKMNILKKLNQASRVYEISGIELSVKGTITEYTVADIYTYSGYAKGYGSELAETDTLSCKVDGFDKYLSLDVHTTYFIPEGINGKTQFTHDCLSSVYFAVPKNVTEEYGLMTRIRGEYLKALTSEIFVTGNDSYYNEFMSMLGVDIGYWEENSSDFDCLIRADGIGNTDWIYNNAKECADYYPNDKTFSRLNYILKATNGDADTYDLSWEVLKTYMNWYTSNNVGGDESLVAERYAASLFSWVADSYTYFDYNSESVTQPLTTVVISQNWWQKLCGTSTTTPSTVYEGKEAIHRVVDSDFLYYNGESELNVQGISNKLYIAQSDVAEFKKFYDDNKEDNEIYLIRYAVDDYVSAEAMEAHWSKVGHNVATGAPQMVYKTDSDTNCYLAQEYVYLNFDIIDLTFSKNNVSTVIPVVMSPMDILHDITHPSQTTTDKAGLTWWQIVLAIIAVIFLLKLLYEFLKWLLSLPAKAASGTAKGIKNSIKRNKRE